MKTDQEIMLDPDTWPRWPYLPLKKPNPYGGFPFLGMLFDDGEKFTFHGGNTFVATTPSELMLLQGGRELVERLINDGWTID